MIGVFDSGVGGLGVVSELRHLTPRASLVYVADHAAAPYGLRTLEEVRRRAELISGWLVERGCDVVTIACNTASAAALHHLRRLRPVTTFVGMEPALKPAVGLTRSGVVGVVATAATFQGTLFASVVDRFGDGVEVVTAACPEWVRLVEDGIVTGPEAVSAVGACLSPMLARGVDVIVLACTHYPALSEVIATVAGPDVQVIDPAPAVARQAAREHGGDGSASGSLELHTTGDVIAPEVARQAVGEHGGDGGEGSASGSLELHTTGDVIALERAASRQGLEASVSLLRLEADGPT